MLYNDHQADIINRMLDDAPGPEDWAALNALLDASPDDALLWDGMRDIDRMLRQAPVLSPSPGFTAQVMAQVNVEGVPNRQGDNGIPLVLRLTILTLIGVGVMFFLRFAFNQLFGPLPALDEVLVYIEYLLNGIVDVVGLLFGFIARFPMLPAIGLASIPLAFAIAWLVIYYTPKDPLRRVAARYLTA